MQRTIDREAGLAAMTVDQVNAAARKWIDPASFAIFKAGDFNKKYFIRVYSRRKFFLLSACSRLNRASFGSSCVYFVVKSSVPSSVPDHASAGEQPRQPCATVTR